MSKLREFISVWVGVREGGVNDKVNPCRSQTGLCDPFTHIPSPRGHVRPGDAACDCHKHADGASWTAVMSRACVPQNRSTPAAWLQSPNHSEPAVLSVSGVRLVLSNRKDLAGVSEGVCTHLSVCCLRVRCIFSWFSTPCAALRDSDSTERGHWI